VRPGSSDLCFEWPGSIDEALEHLRANGIELEACPVERTGARGRGLSLYFPEPLLPGPRRLQGRA
jgi:hypothetical protein